MNTDLGLDWYDYGFRWYDAELGRFPSVDPLAENRLGMTPFNYVSNNPISRIDPNGLTDFYYKSQNGNMAYLGTDGILNGVIAVVVDANIIQQFQNSSGNYIFPSSESYYELPSFENRQMIRKQIMSHYGTYLKNRPSESELLYKIMRNEIGGVGLRYDGGSVREINARVGENRPGQPSIDVFRATDFTTIPDKYTYMANVDGGSYRRINRDFVHYTWHTHPYHSATHCYYKASGKDLSPNSAVGDIRNNFVLAPFNNSIALYRINKTKAELCTGIQKAGASEVIPLNWFFNVQYPPIGKLPTIPVSKMIQSLD